MSDFVTATHRSSWTSNMQLATQQKKSKLAPYAIQQPSSGEKQEVTNLLGSTKPNEATERRGATKFNDTPHDARWCAKPTEKYFNDTVDNADKLASKIDLQGGYTMTASATIARARDDAFLLGFYGSNLTGKDGTTLVPFPSGQIISASYGAGGAVGMSVAKLIEARRLLQAGDVDLDEEEAFMALTPKQEADLIADAKVASSDYVTPSQRRVLETGKLPGLLGFNFLSCNLGSSKLNNSGLTVDGSGYRRVPFWVKSGMAMCTWEELRTFISIRPDLQYLAQVFAGTTVAATRTEETKVGQVLCAE